MRQISDLSTTPESDNASTCGFFERKGRCGRGFRNLPHTSALGFRKCGESRDLPTRPRFYASATCGFVAENRGVLGGFRFSPHFRKLGILSAIRSAFERQAKRAESRTISQRTCWGSVLVAALFYTSTMFNSWGADVNRCVPVLGNIYR